MSEANTESFEEVKRRLDEIVDAVADDDLPLDDALKLYEEAVRWAARFVAFGGESPGEQRAL